MAKFDSKHRLQIPFSLIDESNLNIKVGIFWDAKDRAIYLSNLVNCSNEFCLAIRNFDSKNRITIPDDILELIDANYDSLFVVALKNNRIYIFNRDYSNPQSI